MADRQKDNPVDDFALFREQMRDATRLRHDSQPPATPKPEPRARHHRIADDGPGSPAFSNMFAPESVGNEEYLEYRGPGIQHKLFSKMRSGKIHVEAELDLHGMTIARAEPALGQFLDICQQQQIRYIRIIHGKGLGSRQNKPVLKSKLNFWLRQSDAVLAFCSATVEDGGTGALYVLLRRQHQD